VSAEPETVESEDEATSIFKHLVAERVDARARPALAIHELALLRKVAVLLASDDAGNAYHISALLDRAPSIVSPGARPQPTLAQVCRDDAPLDIELLSNEQLVQLEGLEAVMSGRASPIRSPRQEALLALTWLLDEAARVGGEPDVAHIRDLVAAALPPVLAVEDVFPSHRDELNAERSRRLAAEEEVKRLQHALERAAQSLPENVVRLRREQQA
jgi:hypothetical protein